MKGINGSRKGKSAERDVAALICEWWRQLEPGAEFVRTPQSGGWGTPELRGEFKAAGDLMTTANRFPFTVEVKKRECLHIPNTIAGKPTATWKWWRQVIKAAAEEQRVPMLWFSKNRQPWYVLLPAVVPIADPLHVWAQHELSAAGVDFGGILPACFSAEQVLATEPRRLIPRRRRGHSL